MSAFVHPAPKLIWNASASAPIGLYARATGRRPARHRAGRGARRRAPLASFLAERGYLPKGVPLLKHILALPGQTVCRTGRTITVDGIAMGEALERDRLGRPLPRLAGLPRHRAGEVFLMNWQSEDSLDGRYFGPLPATTIVGEAAPLWTDEEQ